MPAPNRLPAPSRGGLDVTPPDRDVLMIRMNHCNAGFFAQVQFALNQIRYAESRKLTPVVYFGRDSVDGNNAYYDEAAGSNVWEYYFEPVAGITLDEAREMTLRSGRRILTLKYWELWRLHYNEPESVFTYPYGYYRAVVDKSRAFDDRWWAEQRAKGRRLVRDYVRVRPEIMEKVDAFVEEHFAHPVLGVHARGTDKQDVGSGAHLARVVPPADYFPLIDDYLERNAGARIFFATDQRQFRGEMIARYGERVLSFAQTLSDSTVNAFQVQQARGRGNREKGEEVLIDALLLSRCDFLLKCTSAVGEFAQYFSQSLESIDLNYVGLPAPEPRPLRTVVRTGAWRTRRRLGLSARNTLNHWRGNVLEDADHPTRPDDSYDTNRFVGEP